MSLEFTLYMNYYKGHEIKKDKRGRTIGTNGWDEKMVENFIHGIWKDRLTRRSNRRAKNFAEARYVLHSKGLAYGKVFDMYEIGEEIHKNIDVHIYMHIRGLEL